MFSVNKTSIKLLSGSILLFGGFSLNAGSWDGDVVAIQIEKRAAKESEQDLMADTPPVHVQVDERGDKETGRLEGANVQVNERADAEKHVCVQQRGEAVFCEHCNRQVVVTHRPRYLGRVPVGPVYPRYGCGVIAYPCGRTPDAVFIRPCPPCRCQSDFSFYWRISG